MVEGLKESQFDGHIFYCFHLLLLWRLEHSCAQHLFTNSDPAAEMKSVLPRTRWSFWFWYTFSLLRAEGLKFHLSKVFSAFQVNCTEDFWHLFEGFLQERWNFKPVYFLNLDLILSTIGIWPKSASLWIRHSSCILTFLEKIMQVSELPAWVIFYSLES